MFSAEAWAAILVGGCRTTSRCSVAGFVWCRRVRMWCRGETFVLWPVRGRVAASARSARLGEFEGCSDDGFGPRWRGGQIGWADNVST